MTPARPRKGQDRDDWTPQRIKTSELHFDPKNPRFAELGRDVEEGEVPEVLWKEMSVDELALSIAENGFFPHEPLYAAREGGKLVVIEGNRRLAAVRLLIDPNLRRAVNATDLPRISAAEIEALRELPVILALREDLWQYVGFKHVNGPQAWGSFAKAQYIAWVHDTLKVPLDRIANQIGDKHATVRRHYHAYRVVEQAEDAGVFKREERFRGHFSFSHLFTGLPYEGFQEFLGTDPRSEKKNPVPQNKLKNLGELMEWLYGSAPKEVRPVVQSQNPDLKLLDEVLKSPEAIDALRSGLPLRTAHDISRGDEKIFRESLQQAKKALQEARGTMLTGYSGDPGEMETAEAVLELANDLVSQMREVPVRKRARRKLKIRKKASR